jgi:hypothetical protein
VSRLYIIGNGFDRYHGVPSDYRDFATYLRDTDRSTFRIAEEFLPVGGDGWADFEQHLADFDEDQAIDYASQFHSDERHGDFQYELQQIAEALSTKLKAQFTSWVRGLHIPERAEVSRPLAIDPRARFLTFNYTNTLGRVYGVSPAHVMHIHGSIELANEELVLGHGWERSPEDSRNFGTEGPDDDWRIRDGISYIDDFFAATFKRTDDLIARNIGFFEGLADVTEVLVMGHSLAPVDAGYLYEIERQTDPNAVWSVSVFNDLELRQQRMASLGVPRERLRFLPMDLM